MTNLRIVLAVLRDSQIRRVAIGLLAFSIAESATWLAITVYAYERGGVREAGLLQFIQLAPAAAIVPFVSFIGDRFPRDRVLAGGFAAQAITMTACGAAILAEVAAPVVYLLSACAAITVTFTRPTGAAVLPSLVDTPEELTACNVGDSFGREVGAFVGPIVAGLVLMGSSPGVVFVAAGALMGLMVLMTRQLRPVNDIVDDMPGTWHSHLVGGLRLLRSDRDTRLLAILLTLMWLVFGALDVAYVVVAIELLGQGEGMAGVLTAVSGAGGMLGSVVSLTMVSRRRHTLPVTFGALLAGIAFALISLGSSGVVVIPLFVATGLGLAVMDVAGRTMLQCLAPDDTLARLFGVLEGLGMAALAFGALWFAGLAEVFGIEGAIIGTGLVLPVALLLCLVRLLAIDRARPAVDPELLRFVRGVSIFAPLPPYALEQLLSNLVPSRHEPGSIVINEGDEGDLFYLVTEGSAEVQMPDGLWIQARPGEYFGEIALVRDVPRTASVRSGPEGLEVHALDRDVFLAAVTGSDRSMHRLSTTVDSRLMVIDEHRR